MKTFRTIVTVLALFPAGCCLSIGEEDVAFRYEPKVDSLDVLLVYRGVTSVGEEEVKEILEVARQFLSGRRAFMIGPLFFDLDDVASEWSRADRKGEIPDLVPEARRRLVELLGLCRLREREVFVDGDGRLCAYQIFRIEKASELLRLANMWISARLSTLPADCKDIDVGLLKKRAQSGEPWLWFEGPEVVVDIPVTRGLVERIQAQILEKLFTEGHETPKWTATVLELVSHLRQMQLSDERLLLRLGAPPDGVFRFRLEVSERMHDEGLIRSLRDAGIVPKSDVRVEELFRRLAVRL